MGDPHQSPEAKKVVELFLIVELWGLLVAETRVFHPTLDDGWSTTPHRRLYGRGLSTIGIRPLLNPSFGGGLFGGG